MHNSSFTANQAYSNQAFNLAFIAFPSMLILPKRMSITGFGCLGGWMGAGRCGGWQVWGGGGGSAIIFQFIPPEPTPRPTPTTLEVPKSTKKYQKVQNTKKFPKQD
jgi:hypothetical protein